MLIALKLLSVIVALAFLFLAAGWLRGADNVVFPGLGLITNVASLLLLMALMEIILIVAHSVLSALIK